MKKRQIIAVDVDDVLAHHAEVLIEWGNKRYGTSYTIEDYTDHWSEIWSLTHDETEEMAALFHQGGYHREFQPRKDALEVLAELKKSYDLVIVTARRKSILDASRDWLDEHYPNIFNDVRFVPIWEEDRTATKAAICSEVGASYLIDDMPKHCNIAAENGIECLLFGNYIWNRNEKIHPNIQRVKDWQEVRHFFDDIG